MKFLTNIHGCGMGGFCVNFSYMDEKIKEQLLKTVELLVVKHLVITNMISNIQLSKDERDI